jgi:hypothetical protein
MSIPSAAHFTGIIPDQRKREARYELFKYFPYCFGSSRINFKDGLILNITRIDVTKWCMVDNSTGLHGLA